MGYKNGHSLIRIPILLSEVKRYMEVTDLPAHMAFERLVEFDSRLLSEVCSRNKKRSRRRLGGYIEVAFPATVVADVANTAAAAGSLLEAGKLIRDSFGDFLELLQARTLVSAESDLELYRWKKC